MSETGNLLLWWPSFRNSLANVQNCGLVVLLQRIEGVLGSLLRSDLRVGLLLLALLA